LADGVFAAMFTFIGLLPWPYILTVLGLFGNPQDLATHQVPTFFIFLWRLALPLCVLIVVLCVPDERRVDAGSVVRTSMALAGAAGVAVVLVAGLTLANRTHLPIIIVGNDFHQAYWTVLFPILIVAALASLAVVLRRWKTLEGLSLYLAVGVFFEVVNTLVDSAVTSRYTLLWEYSRALSFFTAASIAIPLTNETLTLYREFVDRNDRRVDRSAARLRALWQITTTEGLNEQDHVQMVLDVATANIRSDRDAFGVVSHLENGRVIIDFTSAIGTSEALAAIAAAYPIGASNDLASDIESLLYASGQACGWVCAGDLAELRCAIAGLDRVVGCVIPVGRQTHFVWFGLLSAEPEDVFTQPDLAFVEVIASNIGHRFYQRTQFDRIRHQTEHDALTGLYNRTQFNRHGRLGIADGSLDAVVLIDLDDFRRLNEREGQMMADEILVEIAAHLRSVDERDFVSRLSGDDFGVLLRNRRDDESLEARVAAYAAVFERPFHTGDRDGQVFRNVSASLGAARRSDVPFETLIIQANAALDASQRAGGSCTTIFAEEHEALVLERSIERDEFQRAIETDELTLQYQPTVELKTRSIASCEALLRWNHPERGLLDPDAFLRVAARNQLMGPMTSWVLRRVVADFRDQPVPPGFRCYLNVPAHVLETDAFIAEIDHTVRSIPGIAKVLGVEVTESEVMNRPERAVSVLVRLREHGIRTAIDDFGTGYSSLNYIKRLPVDVLKLDRTFITGLPDDLNDVAIADLFLGITKQLQLASVAEGIETEAQAAWLLEHGCMLGQGYLFARPMEFADLVALLRTKATSVALAG
jgi:diguanylate cyclase (GGDEF)-like protein